MAIIKDDVLSGHLAQYRNERELLVPFLKNFDVTWGRSRTAYNTRISVYFLSPGHDVRQQFGFEREILLAVSDFPTIQPRTIQAIEHIIEEVPAKGRVDPTFFVLITPDPAASEWIRGYAALNSQSRIPVVFIDSDLKTNVSDDWLVRRSIANQMFSRDLFNEQLPLTSDLYFVGRDRIVADFISSAKQGKNRGIFGLRKTGKTSVLFKIARFAERERILVFYYDCKNPAIRNLRWDKFLERINSDIAARIKRPDLLAKAHEHISDQFRRLITAAGQTHYISLIFDEIEYISPLAKLDLHWHSDFVDFWQTLWTTQSEMRKLSFVMAGVNPTVVEIDTVAEVQNPVFGIVSPEYLTGLSSDEVKIMLSQIGSKMGLKFDPEAVGYVVQRYGGHPLLTRMACSHLHNFLVERNQTRPVTITERLLKLTEQGREASISFYCRHVISELRQFYPLEYEMLEMLAAGNVADFIDLAAGGDYIRHLMGYGLIDVQPNKRPAVKLPVVSRFINAERAQKNKTSLAPYIVPSDARSAWLTDRIRRITTDIRQMEKLARERGMPRLYGENGFPEAERFHSITVVDSLNSFDSFINICNRCFVEPIERYGMSISKKKYFWDEVRGKYPDLWHALHRTKLYRNDKMHLALNQSVEEGLNKMLADDFLGEKPDKIPDHHFALQQFVLDGLFVGVQLELDKFI